MSNTLRSYDEANLRAAISQSRTAVSDSCMPFGAVLSDSRGNILLSAHNQSSAVKTRGGGGDVTRHAEMELVRLACGPDGVEAGRRGDCTLYTSCEPCVMCAGAIYWSGIGRVVFGCTSEELAEFAGPGGFDVPLRELYGMGRKGTRRIEVVGPLLSEEAMGVHRESGVWGSRSDANVNASDAALTDIETEKFLFESGVGAAASKRDHSVPVIDLREGSDGEIADRLWRAANTVGFFTVIGHGIAQESIDAAFAVSADFFSLPQKEKEDASPFARNLNSGYEFMTQVRPSTGTADQKESLQITARQGSMDGRWPSYPPNFRTAAETLMEDAHKLANRLLDLMEPRACPHVSKGTLSKSHTLWAEDGQCTLRMLHYPPMDADTARMLTTPDEEGIIFWRAGPHTDWDNITLLFQKVGQPGLECCSNPGDVSKSKDVARWTPIDPIQGGIAVNIGDMLARWSDKRLYSNLHRVRMPTEAECTPPSSRYSIAYFAQSDKRTLIESSDNEPITAGDYILSRIKSNFSSK